jgi:hypothetical protein
VGRISVSEETGRKTQALSRIKLLAWALEDDLQELPQQQIGLWYEHAGPQVRARIGGKGDPFVATARSEIEPALAALYRFRGATRAINTGEMINQLFTWGDKYQAVMNPAEVRALATRVWEEMGLKRLGDVFNPDTTKTVELMAKADNTMKQQQATQMLGPQEQVLNQGEIDQTTQENAATAAMPPGMPPPVPAPAGPPQAAAPGGAPPAPAPPPGNGGAPGPGPVPPSTLGGPQQ